MHTCVTVRDKTPSRPQPEGPRNVTARARMRVAAAWCGVMLAAACGPVAAQQAPVDVSGFSDEAVEKAIKKATDFLWRAQQGDGSWRTPPDNKKNFVHEHPMGCSALPAYALLESGVKVTDARMAKALLHLAKTPSVKTYSLGVRANVWLSAGRQEKKYLELLNRDVAAIVSSSTNGAYSYDCNGDGNSGATRKDNSASQYALLGAWAGARADLEIPPQYWNIVMQHWVGCQNRDGGWGYLPGRAPYDSTTPTMTAAGVASVFVCYDNLIARDPAAIRCRPSKTAQGARKAVAAGLAWFNANFVNSFKGEIRGLYYYLYGVERVGLASGQKYFGKADWYKIGASALIKRQNADGSWVGGWGGPEVSTSFALLFLVRGRNAVLFNKLQFDGDWNNRPRDLACVTRWISRNFEATVNWQTINTSVPVAEWHDAPILYISGSKAPKFTDDDLAAMRTFVHQGGTILSVAECRGGGFTERMYDAYGKMFPKYKPTPCPPKHELYSIHYRLRGTPRLVIVSNGVRPLAIHTTGDLSLSWQSRRYATRKYDFQAAANVFMYVTDKSTALRRRGTTLWPPKPAEKPDKTLALARLKYEGNYDPEPLAYERFSRLMARQTKTGVKVLGPIPIADLAASGAKLAVLTGTEKFSLSADDIKAIKAFVTGGGTLFIDAAGGERLGTPTGFVKAAQTVLAAAFPETKLRRLAVTSPLYQMPEMKIKTVRWRRSTRVTMVGNNEPMLRTVVIKDRPAVIFSRLDITAGLLGTPAAGIYGYHPGDVKDPGTAFRLMRNIIMYAYKDK